MEFTPFPKIPRLRRTITVTEKIDGTNGCIYIQEGQNPLGYSTGFEEQAIAKVGTLYVFAGSRTRWIVPGDDNYGFAAWVKTNAEELAFRLGPGTHFGEWWGYGIQRGYGLPKGERRFSLFNTVRWSDPAARPACCHVVPVLYEGPFTEQAWTLAGIDLAFSGSKAAPGFMKPEGIVMYHHAANQCYKVTLEHDDEPKNATPPKERKPQEHRPKDPTIGGRRIGLIPITFADRRKPREQPTAGVSPQGS